MLQGVRVVELAVWVAGPGAGGILADWGADVVKIEPPEGDPCRSLFMHLAGLKEPKSPPFDLDNRGKRSVVLDLRDARRARARAQARRGRGRVRLEPAARRAGQARARLRDARARAVPVWCTPASPATACADPSATAPPTTWARSGRAPAPSTSCSRPTSSRTAMRGGFGDHVTAHDAGLGDHGGALPARAHRAAASSSRRRSCARACTASAGTRASACASARSRRSLPRTQPLNPVLNQYRSRDGRWFWLLGLEAERHWPKLGARDRATRSCSPTSASSTRARAGARARRADRAARRARSRRAIARRLGRALRRARICGGRRCRHRTRSCVIRRSAR